MPTLPEKLVCGACGAAISSDVRPFEHYHCPECGAETAAAPLFDRYALLGECGVGGMSRVYRAYDLYEKRLVALKVINNGGGAGEGVGSHFLEEVEIACRIDHPGIMQVYRGGFFEDQPFLALELMSKGSLEQLAQRDLLPPLPQIMNWMCTIAGGLEAAWQAGIVHHDVKPGNIMLNDRGEAKIGDFDLAEICNENQASPSENWASPGYVSPERLLSGREDYRGDIFSLGATIYDLVSGSCPFGISGTAEELLERRRAEDQMPLKSLNPAIRTDVSNLVDRMLGFWPECRPEYWEIVKTLQRAADGGRREMNRPGFWRRLKRRFF